MSTPPETVPAEATHDQAPLDAERRAALAKLGRLAALTPPIILTLMISPRASAFSEPPPEP